MLPLRFRRLLIVLVALMMSIGAGVAAVAVAATDPLNGPYNEVHGELVTGLPSTPSCTDTITTAFPFKDTAYGSDPPFTGNYVPTCTGPWSKVVLTMSVDVMTGTQFDRIGDVLIGGVELLHLTTAEGESASTSWSIQRDVSEDASLFTSTQPTYFIIGNQTDSTYTGIFYGTLSLTFYSVGAGAPQAAAADKVVGLTTPLNRGIPTEPFTTGTGATAVNHTSIDTAATIPANTTALTAEVFASGHGAEEEDWWDAPFVCASGGTPYREVALSIDGVLAATAPIFPTIYTGGYGPDFWRPFPSPRAYNLRPYDFDLTPWIGELTDGQPHTYSLTVLDQGGCVGYWFLGSNLLVTTNKTSAGRTTGSITSTTAPALPTDTSTGVNGTPAGNTGVGDMTTSAHHLDTVGTILPANATVPTTDHVVQDMTDAATVAALDVNSDWTWDSLSTLTTGSTVIADSQSSTYELIRTGPSWTLEDDQTTDSTLNGAATGSTSLSDTMTTVGAVEGITGAGNASTESWKYDTSTGICVDHELVGAAQNVVSDTTTTSSGLTNACTASTSPATPSPNPSSGPTAGASPAPTATTNPPPSRTLISAPRTQSCVERASALKVTPPRSARLGGHGQLPYTFTLSVGPGSCKTPSAVGRQLQVLVDGHPVATLRTGRGGTIRYLVRLTPGRHAVSAEFKGNRDLRKSSSARVVSRVL